MFTKRHYEAIAHILKKTKPTLTHSAQEMSWSRVVDEFVTDFELRSPLFNKDKFLKACGYESYNK